MTFQAPIPSLTPAKKMEILMEELMPPVAARANACMHKAMGSHSSHDQYRGARRSIGVKNAASARQKRIEAVRLLVMREGPVKAKDIYTRLGISRCVLSDYAGELVKRGELVREYEVTRHKKGAMRVAVYSVPEG